MAKRKITLAEELMEEINSRIAELTDSEYCDILEEIAEICADAANAKREEMG